MGGGLQDGAMANAILMQPTMPTHLAPCGRCEYCPLESIGKGAGHQLCDDDVGHLLCARSEELGRVGVVDLAQNGDLGERREGQGGRLRLRESCAELW